MSGPVEFEVVDADKLHVTFQFPGGEPFDRCLSWDDTQRVYQAFGSALIEMHVAATNGSDYQPDDPDAWEPF